MKKFLYFLPIMVLFLIGCSASEITEEYTGEQQEVEYKTEEQPSTPTAEEKSPVEIKTEPEYIPQGPPNPPPPPVKVQLSSTTPTETRAEETPPVTGEIYQYKVQVFAFKSKLNAETEARRIRERLPDQQVFVEFENNLYKVRMGAYSKWEHANGIKDALLKLGYRDPFIITEVRK